MKLYTVLIASVCLALLKIKLMAILNKGLFFLGFWLKPYYFKKVLQP